eukprot:3849269-Pleurochrysis_carterae.AAC.10
MSSVRDGTLLRPAKQRLSSRAPAGGLRYERRPPRSRKPKLQAGRNHVAAAPNMDTTDWW